MEEKEMLSLLQKEVLEMEEVIDIASVDYSDFQKSTVDEMYDTVSYILSTNGLEIDERKEKYPNDPYLWGYCLDGVDFFLYYTGNAGHYWGNTIACDIRDYRDYLK